MKEKIYKLITSLVAPVLRQLPFFVIIFLILAERAIRGIHSQLVEPSMYTNAYDLSGQVALAFLWAYIFTLIVDVSGKKWVKICLYIFGIALFAICKFLWLNFGMTINPHAITLLVETNSREASGFVSSFVLASGSLLTYLYTAILVVVTVVAEIVYHRRYKVVKTVLNTGAKKCAAALFTLFLAYGLHAACCYFRIFSYETNDQLNNVERLDVVYPSDPISALAQSCYGLHLSSNETRQALQMTANLKPSTVEAQDSLDVVLIIGESYNKWHAGIYGYPLNTTPHMSEEMQKGNLIAFSDAVTSQSLTSPSMKNMLCCNSFSHGEKWFQSPYFPAIFKSAGYDVFFWDNQKFVQEFSQFTFSINSFIYNKDLERMSYTQGNTEDYNLDFPIVYNYVHTPRKMGKYNLVMFHLMGQHSPPKARYPKVPLFEHFTADSIIRSEKYITTEKKQLIAQYDNSTLYNDHVVNAIFNIFRNRNAIVVYLSDHGEETYDYKDATWRTYHGLEKGWVKHIHNVPFVVWCSDIYMQNNPDKVEAIRNAAQRPFAIDNLCHMMFNIAQIKTPYYNAERDVISPAFKKHKRLVEGKDDYVIGDYDKILNEK